jgi:plastocyanin
MRMYAMGWGLLALFASGMASAAQLAVTVADREGKPVGDAVVSLLRQDGAGPHAAAPSTHTIDQKDLTFIPYVEVFRPGDRVVFHNSDHTRHHVYSFSPAKTFEYVIAPEQAAPPLKLDRTGVIAVGCNIHDSMISYLYVTDASWFARTDASGRVQFGDLPAGAYDVRVWHPRLPPARPDLVQEGVVLGADERRQVPFALTLLPDLRFQFDREHTRY